MLTTKTVALMLKPLETCKLQYEKKKIQFLNTIKYNFNRLSTPAEFQVRHILPGNTVRINFGKS